MIQNQILDQLGYFSVFQCFGVVAKPPVQFPNLNGHGVLLGSGGHGLELPRQLGGLAHHRVVQRDPAVLESNQSPQVKRLHTCYRIKLRL